MTKKANNIYVSASTLPPSEKQLLGYVKELEKSGVDFLHCDLMDGEFVKNVALSTEKIKEIALNTTLMLDVHLMANNPYKIFKDLISSRVNIITLHYEQASHKKILEDLKAIKSNQIMAGLAINPQSSVDEIIALLPYVDIVLVMSVTAGAGGQKFIESTYEKVRFLDKLKKEKSYNFLIEVDGGINDVNAPKLIKSGANILAVGSYIFVAKDKNVAVKAIKKVTN